ncbi:hypothetical protein ABZ749_24465 [Micromonospora sp. NPDC047753]|uniref:hypothetical protein n=1 Tax=Micromonospora sp. NPDC047753 TaxID=3154817 RepID=UPI0034050897
MPVLLGCVGVAWMSAFAQLTLLAGRPADLLAGAALTALVLLAVVLAARVRGRAGAPGPRSAAGRPADRHRPGRAYPQQAG